MGRRHKIMNPEKVSGRWVARVAVHMSTRCACCTATPAPCGMKTACMAVAAAAAGGGGGCLSEARQLWPALLIRMGRAMPHFMVKRRCESCAAS